MTRLSLITSALILSLLGLSSAFVFPTTTTTTQNKQHKPAFVAGRTKVNSAVNDVLENLEKKFRGESLTYEEKLTTIEASQALMEHLYELQSAPQYDDAQLLTAVSELDADAVSNMLNAGLTMNEETTNTAFWTVVNAIDTAEASDQPLSGDVPRMIHHIFDADHQHLLTREKLTTNVTCMQPDESDAEAASRKMNYIFDDGDHKNLPLAEGRKCEDGNCCDECSRNVFPTFATLDESNLDAFPDLGSLTFNDLETVSAATILQFVRLIERVRRTISHEYGLPLKTILPLQAYSRKYIAGTTQKGGGGGEGDFVTLHTDEATHSGYHYSCVIYLNTMGEDFEGGAFIFNDPGEEDEHAVVEITPEEEESEEEANALFEAWSRGEDLPDSDDILPVVEEPTEEAAAAIEAEMRKSGRVMTPFHPTRGAAVIFSSGWENMHEVEKITSGVRYAVPCFFTTCPVPDMAYEQMNVGKPQTDENIADDWLHLLLAHRKEDPMESVGRVKELLMKWHVMCTPLTEH